MSNAVPDPAGQPTKMEDGAPVSIERGRDAGVAGGGQDKEALVREAYFSHQQHPELSPGGR